MVMGGNSHGPKWLSRDVRKQTVCICKNKDTKQISVFVFALLSKSEISVVKLSSVTVRLSFCHNCLETSMFVFSRRRDTMLKTPIIQPL